MTIMHLSAQPRTVVGKAVDRLRRQRNIPAVVYGHNFPSQPVTLDAKVFDTVYRQAGSTSLVDLSVGSASPVKVLIHAIQRHPTTSQVLHVDFYQVKMSEKLEADIELRFVGESVAVKELGGVLVRALDDVKVSCLPSDLVSSIDVDIKALQTFEDKIHVRDLTVPAGLTILDKAEEVVASVTPPRSEAELASLSEQVEENVEAVEVGKKEEATDEATSEAVTEEPNK